MPFSEYRNEIYSKYREFKDSLPPPNTEASHHLHQPILDFNDSVNADRNAPGDTLKSVIAQMYAAKNQFTGLVCITLFIMSITSNS